jgi:hypothetical protein
MRIPDDRQLAAMAAFCATHAQPNNLSITLAVSDQGWKVQKHIPATRPAEDAEAIAMLMERAQSIEFDDHTGRYS